MKKLLLNLFIIIGLLTAAGLPAYADTITGKVVAVSDGTITIEAADQLHELEVTEDLLEAVEPGDQVTVQVDGKTVTGIAPAQETEEKAE